MISFRYSFLPLILLATVYGGFSARILPGEKPLTALIFAGAVLFATGLAMQNHRDTRIVPRWCGLTFVHAVILLLPLAGFSTLRPGWVLSSFLTYTSIAAFATLMIFLTESGRSRLFSIYLSALALAAVLAPLAAYAGGVQRFEPPGFLLISATLVWFGRSKSPWVLIAVLVVLAFGFASQVRINFILCAGFALAISLTRIRDTRAKLVVLLTFAVLGALLLPWLLQMQSAGLPGAHRIEKLLTSEGFYREVVLRRGLEVKAALAATADGKWWQLLFGHGHGATYPARLLLLELSAGHTSVDWRFTDTGDAFVLHFGPVRLLYRTGVIGFLLFMLPVSRAALAGIQVVFARPVASRDIRENICALASTMWFFKFLLSPAETDFGFAIAVGGYLAFALHRRRGAAGSVAGTFSIQTPPLKAKAVP